MTLPIQYAFEGHEVRVLMIQGEPWFVATDVATALQYLTAKDMVRNLDADEKGRQVVPTLGGSQKLLVINEPGLYSAILRSRKEEAKRFKRWVTHEVLPALRKHGAYVMPTAEPSEPADAPMSAHIEADQIVSAGRVFRALFTTGRAMGMPRKLAAARANQAAQRATGIDLAAELNASAWLEGNDLPSPHRRQYELQQQVRDHLTANDWPQGFSSQQLIEALQLQNTRAVQTAVGQCLQLAGYRRVRQGATERGGVRPYVYVLQQRGLILEAAA
ncbi:MAG: BRO domain protein [Aquipseudomonas alcaligenes]|uniref:BRO domain protein n=1 Tax=Aquipseudomonas alcaligenes TaxID=43263 RepID=A0A5C7WCC4_AQUAC|nr:MAG: BRO domain protein [Pseudomonas alcaligenes]